MNSSWWLSIYFEKSNMAPTYLCTHFSIYCGITLSQADNNCLLQLFNLHTLKFHIIALHVKYVKKQKCKMIIMSLTVQSTNKKDDQILCSGVHATEAKYTWHQCWDFFPVSYLHWFRVKFSPVSGITNILRFIIILVLFLLDRKSLR